MDNKKIAKLFKGFNVHTFSEFLTDSEIKKGMKDGEVQKFYDQEYEIKTNS